MADRVGSRRRRGVRVLFGLAIVAALGLGGWGLGLYVRPAPDLDGFHRILDVAYDDLQLFVLSSDPLHGGPYPWQLEVARFLAPLATVYALVEAVLVVLGERMARRNLRRRKGHTIVIGDSAAAHAIARGLARTTGAEVVSASNGEPETLRAHGIVGAAAIYACETEETYRGVNVATVLTAAALRPQGGLQAYAQVVDPALALTLRARRLGLPSGDKARLDFFNVEEVAARLVIEATDLETEATPHVLISGLGTFGRAVLVEYARHWRLRSPWREYRPVVTVVDPDAATGVKEIISQWPFVGDVCRITFCHRRGRAGVAGRHRVRSDNGVHLRRGRGNGDPDCAERGGALAGRTAVVGGAAQRDVPTRVGLPRQRCGAERGEAPRRSRRPAVAGGCDGDGI
jgi:hypothetical protein